MTTWIAVFNCTQLRSQFTLKWWHELHRIIGMKLLMSTSFHPQMDEAIERANRSIGQMFQALIKLDQKNWVEKSPLIEFAINLSIDHMLCMVK